MNRFCCVRIAGDLIHGVWMDGLWHLTVHDKDKIHNRTMTDVELIDLIKLGRGCITCF